jgi:hypothetical protein
MDSVGSDRKADFEVLGAAFCDLLLQSSSIKRKDYLKRACQII